MNFPEQASCVWIGADCARAHPWRSHWENANISRTHKSSFGLSDNFSKKHMIQSVTFIIIRPRALHPVVYPPPFYVFFLSLWKWTCLVEKSIRKIFLTFIHSCTVRNVMRSDNDPLCCVIILYIQIQGEKKQLIMVLIYNLTLMLCVLLVIFKMHDFRDHVQG